MDSSSSSNHSSDEERKLKLVSDNSLIVLPFLTPPPQLFIHNPFTSTLFRFRTPSSSSSSIPNLNKPNLLQSLVTTATTSDIVHNLHNSIVSTADRCLRFLHYVFASHDTPLLNKLLSLSSNFQRFCQSDCRNYRNLNSISNHNFAAILPGDSVAGIVVTNGILNFLNVYNTLLVVRLVLTWFPNSPPAIVSPLSTLCDPYLNIFRGIIPPLGGTLDLSPILAFLVLNAFTSTASALPAELPSAGVSHDIPSSRTAVSQLTTSQKKWMRRFTANGSKSSSSDS